MTLTNAGWPARMASMVLGCGLALGGAGCAILVGPEAGAVPAGGAKQSLEVRVAELEQADNLYRAGRWSEAQQAYEQLAARYSRNTYVWLRLGNSLARQGQYENAAVALQNAVMVEGTNGPAAFNLGLVRLAQAQSAFDHARTRLAGQPTLRVQAESLRRRVEALIADIDTMTAKDTRAEAALVGAAVMQPGLQP